jgi:acyl transferase domain-containing protein
MESLKAVFGPHHSLANPLVVGSIKSNIGHSEAASGAAGLAKLLLMLRHHKIPVQAGLRNINPRFADMASAGLVTPSETVAWSHAHKTPRRALLNNFGASGSNASLLLEEWVAEPAKGRNINKLPERSAYVFALSTKSPKALQRAIEQHIQYLRDPTSSTTSVEDICYTAVARRQIHEYRISVTCTSVSDLRAKLESLGTLGTMRAIVPARHISKSVFVFSGQGSLYEGMGRELMSTLPRFKNVIVKCDTVLQGLGYPSILSFFSGPSGHAREILSEKDHVISSQCACVALEYALAVVFVSWGIVPQYVMGHRYVTSTTKRQRSTLLTYHIIFAVSANMRPCVSRVC